MNQESSKNTSLIDKMIFLFMIIFIASLSNSIFINQIGYYGALILFIVRYFITKENPFSRSGLEAAFLWFIAAEVISAFLSDYQSAAFTNVLKRTLLLGIVYVTVGASFYVSRTKIYFKLYIIATLVTCIIYLYHSYNYFINGLFNVMESGPSVFQYPITSSEIMSFTVVFLFAFLVNEKTTWRNKLLILAGFLISSAALFATYKRTGWLGTAAGFFVILLVKREWKYLIPAVAVLLVFFMLERDISTFSVYRLNGNAEKELEIETDGRASDITGEEDYIIVADYNNGIVLYRDSVLISRMETPAPALSVQKWKDEYFIAYLLDTRFILFRKTGQRLNPVLEFTTPAVPVSITVAGGYLYVSQPDSGLIIYKDPENFNNQAFISSIREKYIFAENGILVSYTPGGNLEIFPMTDGIPQDPTTQLQVNGEQSSIFYGRGKLFVSEFNRLSLYNIDESGKLRQTDETENFTSIFRWLLNSGRLFAMNYSGNLFELEFASDSIIILNRWDIGPARNIAYRNGRLYTAYNERNRLLSFVDPYHPTNFTRLGLWETGLRIFKDHPFFGVGDIGLGDYHKKYKGYYVKQIHGHLHNNFMHILATLGLFGLLAVIYMFVKIVIIDLRIYNELKNEPFASSYALGAMGTFTAFLFSGMTELNFGDHEIISLVFFIFGLNLAFYKNHLSVHKTDTMNGNI